MTKKKQNLLLFVGGGGGGGNCFCGERKCDKNTQRILPCSQA